MLMGRKQKINFKERESKMRSKPIRKNPNKERIFSQKQNIEDFDYIKDHRGKVDGENPKLAQEKHCTCCMSGKGDQNGNCIRKGSQKQK